MTAHKAVLNVGGNNKNISIPRHYEGWRHDLLDIDPRGNPDVLCDSRNLHTLAPGRYDAVYCAHNLEHYFAHDVPRVLQGFVHVLNDEGFAEIRVPDIEQVMREVVAKGLDIEDVLYESGAGPITVKDVLYGWGVEIAASGNDFYAHRTGFTPKSLAAVLNRSGFGAVFIGTTYLEVQALAFKTCPTDGQRALFQLAS